MLTCLFILGAESIRWFVLTLIIGIIIGTYSSVFLATPLLVYWRKQQS
jgi:preprotein translocase subunit SecF